jgi:tetratricopeptide (TPR) repeat protein
VTWGCALARNVITAWPEAISLADMAVKDNPRSISRSTVRGAILYRAGQFEEAVEQLTKASNLIEDSQDGPHTPPAYAWYFLAMAHHAAGNSDEAASWLRKAAQWTDQVLENRAKDDNAPPWNRRLTLQLLCREAEALIGSAEAVNDEAEN